LNNLVLLSSHDVCKIFAGILRSSTALGKRLHTLLPCVFPYSRAISRIEQEVAKHEQPLNNKLLQRRSNSNDLTSDDNEIIRLITGDSLRLNRLDSPLTKPKIVSFPYRQNIKRGNTKLTFSTTKAVADFLHSISTDCPQRDENEISLSEDETTELPDKAAADCLQQEEKERIYLREEGAIDLEVRSLADNAKTVHPHLLVLGTGCAAPSSLRGSSAYAIFLPFSHHAAALNSDNNSALALFALLDCGEGCLTSLAQYSPDSISVRQSLLSLKFIWISHSHLDHYGGLATIIEAIDDASYSDCEDLDKPIVVAPLKVLQYLDECLGCVNGVLPHTSNNKNTSNKMMHRLFYGTTHREFQSNSIRSGGNTVREKLFSYKLRHSTTQQLWQPVAGLKNVPVEHCPYSYSLIIDFQYPEIEGGCDKIKTFSLCYSGDCRPSSKLISECQRHRQRPDLVIHEATFDDDMRQEAIAKRHSTVSEALEVVSKMGVKACLLSHFSQRYPHTSKKYVFKYSSQDHANNSMLCTVKFCSAYDGLFLPLSEKFLTTSLALLNSAMASFLNPIE
jgi:ribonuclease BN (tRNA processing enzyme)